MPKPFLMLIIGLFFGVGGGFVLGAANPPSAPGHDHAAADGHHDATLDISAETLLPTVALDLQPDTGGDYNLQILTENFTFAPRAVDGPHSPGQGHAHIYINGVKLARTYSPWFHLTNLPDGAVEIRVTLNANSHQALAIGQEPVVAMVTLPADRAR